MLENDHQSYSELMTWECQSRQLSIVLDRGRTICGQGEHDQTKDDLHDAHCLKPGYGHFDDDCDGWCGGGS